MNHSRRLKISLIILATVHLIAVSADRLKQFSFVSMLGLHAPGSSFELLKLNLFMHLPMMLFTPLVGALLDRWSKGAVLLAACTFRAALILVIPPLFAETGSLYSLYGVAFFLAIADLTFGPARSAILPELVDEDGLLHANAWFWALSVLSALVGFLGGGWLFDYRSWQASFNSGAVLYLAAALVMVPAVIMGTTRASGATAEDPKHPALSLRTIMSAIRDGARLIAQDHDIAVGLLTQSALFAVGGVISVIAIAHIQEVADVGRASFLGIIATALIAGLIVGSGLASMFRRRSTVERTVSVGALLAGVAITGMGRTETIIPLSVWAALLGVSMSPVFIVTETLIQQRSPREFLGRVFAAREAMIKAAYLATAALATFVNTFVSKPAILVALGLFLALMGVVLERTKWIKTTSNDAR